MIAVVRAGKAEIAVADTVVRPGDQVVAVLEPGLEDTLRKALMGA